MFSAYAYGINIAVISKSSWADRKVSVRFENLENRWRGLVVTWQPVRGDLTAPP